MTQEAFNYETIALEVIKADQAIEQWNARKEYLRKLLVDLHAQGQAPEKFKAGGRNWTRTSGKKTWTYPEPVQQAESQLKSWKTICQNDGSATYVEGDPFYTSREAKTK